MQEGAIKWFFRKFIPDDESQCSQTTSRLDFIVFASSLFPFGWSGSTVQKSSDFFRIRYFDNRLNRVPSWSQRSRRRLWMKVAAVVTDLLLYKVKLAKLQIWLDWLLVANQPTFPINCTMYDLFILFCALRRKRNRAACTAFIMLGPNHGCGAQRSN